MVLDKIIDFDWSTIRNIPHKEDPIKNPLTFHTEKTSYIFFFITLQLTLALIQLKNRRWKKKIVKRQAVCFLIFQCFFYFSAPTLTEINICHSLLNPQNKIKMSRKWHSCVPHRFYIQNHQSFYRLYWAQKQCLNKRLEEEFTTLLKKDKGIMTSIN